MSQSNMELPPTYYDTTERVLFVDYTGVTLTAGLLKQVLERVKVLAQNLPQKVYLLSCWKDTILAPDLIDEYGSLTTELLKYVHAVVRYESNVLLTNVTIRANTVRYHLQGTRSNIYTSKEEALAAIRELEKGNPTVS